MDSGNRSRVSNLFGKIPNSLWFYFDEEKANFTSEMFLSFKEKILPITKWNKKTYPDLTKNLIKQRLMKNLFMKVKMLLLFMTKISLMTQIF